MNQFTKVEKSCGKACRNGGKYPVTRPRGAAVALARGGDGTTQLLKSGDSLDGWRLVGIGRDSVTFEMGGDRQVSMLDFRNRTNMPQSTSASPPGAGVSTIAMPEGTGE